MNNEPNWNEINLRKQKEMANLNAANNASLIVSSKKYMSGEEQLKDWEWWRNEIYKLNMLLIDHEAAQAVSGEDQEP